MDKMYFDHRSLHKYIRVARVQDVMELKSMIALVLMKKDMLDCVRAVR